MVMIIRETTVWDDVARQPNHIYLMDGNKALAYIPFGEGKPFYFKNGLVIDKARRKFEEVKENLFDIKVKSDLIEVKGSKGNKYFVDAAQKTCTCPGFTFRGDCRHVKELA